MNGIAANMEGKASKQPADDQDNYNYIYYTSHGNTTWARLYLFYTLVINDLAHFLF